MAQAWGMPKTTRTLKNHGVLSTHTQPHTRIMRNKGYQGHLGRKEKLQNKQTYILRKKLGSRSGFVEPFLNNRDFFSSVLSPSRLTSCVTVLSICAVGKGLVQRPIYKDQKPDLLKPSAMQLPRNVSKISSRLFYLQVSTCPMI